MKRKGIASIVGTLFFALTFLAAVGTFMYIEGAQTQYNQAVQNAQATVDQRQRESLTYQAFPNGTLGIENTGTSSSQLVAAILKLANGSVFSFSQTSTLGSNAVEPVPALIPMNQNCGTSTCLSRYNYILGSTQRWGQHRHRHLARERLLVEACDGGADGRPVRDAPGHVRRERGRLVRVQQRDSGRRDRLHGVAAARDADVVRRDAALLRVPDPRRGHGDAGGNLISLGP